MQKKGAVGELSTEGLDIFELFSLELGVGTVTEKTKKNCLLQLVYTTF
jgi:hypothetical protein